MNSNISNIVLLGATGYTAKIIAERLAQENIAFIPAGRNLEHLSQCYPDHETILGCDIQQDHDIENLIKTSDLLINCVGPYNYYGPQLAAAMARSGKIYLDLTGEQDFVYQSFKKLTTTAENQGALLIHSMAFESCLADLIATILVDPNKAYTDISSFYHFSQSRPSMGTRLTMALNPHYANYHYKNGETETSKAMSYHVPVSYSLLPDVTHAGFMPYPETLFFSNKYQVKNASSYLLMKADEARMGKFLSDRQTAEDVEHIIHRFTRKKARNPDENERKQQHFMVLVNAIDPAGKQEHLGFSGNDMYGLTARLVVEAVKILNTKSDLTGIVSPATLFDPATLMAGLIREGILTKLEGKFTFSHTDQT